MPDLNQREKNMVRLVKPYLLSSQNERHTEDVMNFALRLLKTEKGEREVVMPAVILHDAGWSQVPEPVMVKARIPGRDMKLVKVHEDEGVRIARGILEKVIGNETRIKEILQIIEGHDTREEAISINDQIVKDADKISRYSALFMPTCNRAGMDPAAYCDYLESQIKTWFFLPVSMKMANEELLKRKQEIEADRQGQ